jgi:hypothetical protein
MENLDLILAFINAPYFKAAQIAVLKAAILRLETQHLDHATLLTTVTGLPPEVKADADAHQAAREAQLTNLNTMLAALQET